MTAARTSCTSSNSAPRTSSPVARSSRTASTPSSSVTPGCMWRMIAIATRSASSRGIPIRSRSRLRELRPLDFEAHRVTAEAAQAVVVEQRRRPEDPPIEAPTLPGPRSRRPSSTPGSSARAGSAAGSGWPRPTSRRDLVLRDREAPDLLGQGDGRVASAPNGSEPRVGGVDRRSAGGLQPAPRWPWSDVVFLDHGTHLPGRCERSDRTSIDCDARRAGHEVTGTTRLPAASAGIRAAGARPVIVDVFDGPALEVAVVASRAEVVIYQVTDLALAPGETLGDERLERNARVREAGTRHVVAATAAAGARRLIAQSVAWLYLPGPEPHTGGRVIVPPPPATTPRTRQAVIDLEHLVTTDARFEGVVFAIGGCTGPGHDRHPRRAADGPRRGGGEGSGAGRRSGRAGHLPHRQRRRPGLDREGPAAPRLEPVWARLDGHAFVRFAELRDVELGHLSIASMARAAPSGSLPCRNSLIGRGTTCHDTPKRSLSQPHGSGLAALARQRLPIPVDFGLVVAVDGQRDRLGERELGAAVEPDVRRPPSVNSTVITSLGPAGLVSGRLYDETIRLSGMIDVYNRAASSAWRSNHRQGETLDMSVPFPFVRYPSP